MTFVHLNHKAGFAQSQVYDDDSDELPVWADDTPADKCRAAGSKQSPILK
ncbi:hypothetical protein SBDP1_30047 [Syntrophobacter sp. SbD1]|nr:hypothetical protein SBDP1_30047 [Syntrophobacter sp. SbD1]